jgi:hypothetical protein
MVSKVHSVELSSYDEPGITWSFARCSCEWEGPWRVWAEQATIDAARHLHNPDQAEFGADWHDVVGRERSQLYEWYLRVLDD